MFFGFDSERFFGIDRFALGIKHNSWESFAARFSKITRVELDGKKLACFSLPLKDEAIRRKKETPQRWDSHISLFCNSEPVNSGKSDSIQ